MKKSAQSSTHTVRNTFSRWMWHFDRIFGDNKKLGWQIAIIVALILTLTFVVGLIGFILLKTQGPLKHPDAVWIQSIGLVFGASNLPPGEGQTFPLWWQSIAFLCGAVCFSGVTITFVGNWLGNRQEAYKKGTVRYWFNDHLLFLGGSRIILPMLKVVAEDSELRQKDVVVLTADDVELLRTEIDRSIPSETLGEMKITVLSGDHYDRDTLQSVHVGQTRKLYIIGDHLSGSEHDSENVACWEEAKTLCSGREHVPCYLYLSRTSSVHMFQRRNDPAGDSLDTTVINFLESVAQSVLVHNGKRMNDYPPLDRNGIRPDDDRTVHLVVVGSTSVSYAMATTAAHLCHFPNSVDPKTLEVIPSRRTKITYIAPDMKEEMGALTSHLASLFKLSHYCYRNGRETEEVHAPDPLYGDFLDVEWEFLDGRTSDGWVIERLKRYCKDCLDGKTYLTMAFCEKDADHNIAAAVYLPSEFHKIYRLPDGQVDYEKTVPLLVYQPNNEKLVRNAHLEAPVFGNLLPFGSMRESYAPTIRQRIVEGKRINYIYNKGLKYVSMTTKQKELDDEWHKKTYLKQVSNIYGSNHIGVKLRSMGVNEESLRPGDKTPEELVEIISVVEHNRWNMEKLLMNFEAMEQARRVEIKRCETTGNGAVPQKVRDEMNQLKDNQYIHYCIASYGELWEDIKEYDRLIVRNLADVLIGA